MTKSKSAKKKQSILLLELLIALTLFSLCVLPLVELPFHALSEEIKSCQRMQLQRLADLSFADIEAQLFQNQISWEDLSCRRNEKTQLIKDIQAVQLKGIGKRSFERTCAIWTSRRKNGKDQEQHRLVTIEVEYKAIDAPHFFPTRKSATNKTVFHHQAYVVRTCSSPISTQ